MKTWTCIARCSTCKVELNRAEGVPESDKYRVGLVAPFNARGCPNKHDSFSDINFHFDLEWVEEPESATA